jgi:ubiquinol-cytochrome c reductase cytochrome b subunit
LAKAKHTNTTRDLAHGRPPASTPPQGVLERYAKISSLNYPVPAHGRTLAYTLGGITFVGFMVLFASGLLLQQFFDPAPERAYTSVEHLVKTVPGGAFLRAFHYWAAQAVVLTLLLHLARVFFGGAYKAPRTLTWYFGVALLGTALFGSYFTGTVLKWDQESFDALVHYRETLKTLGPIGSFLGSTEAVSLNVKLFASHVTLLPLVLVLLIAGHFYLVHVLNLSPLPFGEDSARSTLPSERLTGTFMEHTRSILLYGAIYYALVAGLAWAIPAPLGPPVSGEEMSIKPPWPFLWLYAIENFTGRMDTMVHGIVTLLLVLAVVPLLDRGPERNPMKRRGTIVVGAVVLLTIVGLSVYAAVTPPQMHHHEGTLHEGSAPQAMPHDGPPQGMSHDMPMPHADEGGHPHDEAAP